MPVVQPEARNRVVGGEFSGRGKAADEEAPWQDQGWHSRNPSHLCTQKSKYLAWYLEKTHTLMFPSDPNS